MAPGGAALVVTTLSLLAILLPASSAGLSPTASASYTLLAFDASASSPSPRMAEAEAPPPVVDQPFHDATSPPPPPPVVDEPFRDATTSLSPPPPVADERFRDATSPPPPPPVADEPFRDAKSAPPPPPVVDEPFRDATTSPPPPSLVVDDEAYRDATTIPPPPPPPPAPPVVLHQIAKVLLSLGYNEMASSATLLADSPRVETWPGGAITIFGVPDVFLQHSCPDFSCSRSRSRRRHLLLHHMALGYYPYAALAAAPAIKLPSASIGFCLDVVAQRPRRGPFSLHYAANLYVNGVIVSQPDLYDDGRYVVHGLHGFIPPLSHASCDDAHAHHHHHQVHLRHHHHRSATSAAPARIMIREAISRLRDRGFGFVALAMRVKFPAELEKLSNVTVFALNDQAIFTDGGGGHGYVSALRFHIVPGHRLTRADLLLLRPGTLLPTLAGEDQNLAITLRLGSTDEVRINYVAVKEPDLVINSRVAVHGIYHAFPRLAVNPHPRLPFSARGHQAHRWERDYNPTSVSSSSFHGGMILNLAVVAAILAVLGKIVEIAVRIFAMLVVAE